MLFFEDEASFGRINSLNKCWVPLGTRAIVDQQKIREYVYAYTAVCPQTGENYSIISPVNNTEAMNVFLDLLSKAYLQYRILLCMDSAGWHTGNGVNFPKNIEPLFLPPYSPELNPTEHIWDYIREQKQFKNHSFKSLDAAEAHLEAVLKEIGNEKSVIKSMCNFSWLQNLSC